MTQFYALTPKQAIEMIEAAGVEDAARLIRDHAAAGLVKTYAQMQVTIPVVGQREIVRDAALSAALWERMIDEGVDGDAWSGGTVRLVGSELVDGVPSVHITGVTFNPGHVRRLADQQRPRTCLSGNPEPLTSVNPEVASIASRKKETRGSAAIPTGAVLCTIRQAGEMLGCGRTKINELMKSGHLERRMVGSSPRITVESVMAFTGNR